jgi:hypothetical protein
MQGARLTKLGRPTADKSGPGKELITIRLSPRHRHMLDVVIKSYEYDGNGVAFRSMLEDAYKSLTRNGLPKRPR